MVLVMPDTAAKSCAGGKAKEEKHLLDGRSAQRTCSFPEKRGRSPRLWQEGSYNQ